MDTNTIHAVFLPTGHRLSLHRGDIADEAADAVVSAANNQLLHTSGVAGAIAARAGAALERESRRVGWVETGGVAVTTGGRLRARHVIHAVGPRWNEHASAEADRLLASAATAALEAACALDCLSVAFPALSSGTFGFPADRSARVLLGAAAGWASAHPTDRPRYVRFTIIDEGTATTFTAAFREMFPPHEETT